MLTFRLVDIMTYIAIVGAIVVSFGYPLIANIIWLPTNTYLAWYNYKNGQMALARLFIAYDLIAMFGVYWLWLRLFF